MKQTQKKKTKKTEPFLKVALRPSGVLLVIITCFDNSNVGFNPVKLFQTFETFKSLFRP